MNLTSPEHDTSPIDVPRERARLIGLCALMLLAGAGFASLAGPPRVPTELPQIQDIVATLSGSTLPVAAVVLVLVDLAWLMWLWIVGSLCLELMLAAAEMTARSAAWVQSLRRLSDRVSMPLARRAVAAAFAMQVLSRGVPIAAAQTIEPGETALVADAHAWATTSAVRVDAAAGVPTYLVRDGDTLWSIAERAYGTGMAYRRVVDANLGRRMDDGQVFSARGVIRPGWQLVVPDADSNIEEVDGDRWYTVQPGDTLSAIAASTLGDSSRWDELFSLNHAATTPDGLHSLADANVIWPGLRLRLPQPPAEPAAAEAEQAIAALAAPEDAQAPDVSAPAALPDYAPPAEPPPLLRTAHALDPVVLEPADLESNTVPPAAEETPAANAASTPPSPALPTELPTVPLAVGGLGIAAVAGLAFGARRIRRLRPLPQEPESEVVVEGGFAEALLAHDLTRGLHGVGFDPLAALIGRLEQFLNEYNLTNVGVVAVRHGRSSTTITLHCALAEQPILIDLAPVFAERLDAEAEAWVSTDQDVSLRLTRLRRTRLLPAADAPQHTACLVPLGVLYDRQVYSAEWNSVGHVLMVSLPGHGADTILTSLVATLTARRSPEQLRVWMLASSRALPAPLFELPHMARVVDPADDTALNRAADDLRGELDRRANHQPTDDLVVVVPELTSLGEHAATFALLASHAAELGVHLVAASTSPDAALASPLTSHFGTRMVLRMQAEETSVALLGVADAAFLSGGGRLLLRMDGREPVELYGYQVAAEHLERLVRVMRSAYASIPTPQAEPLDPAPPAEPADASPPLAPTEPAPLAHAPESTLVELDSSTPACPPLEPALDVAAPPPITVICFQGPHVLCADQQLWPKQPGGDAKPWELLLYLACQPAEGVSRDQVIEALWPEDDCPEDAPHRFRQLRYRLRRLLLDVPGAPQTEGVCLQRGTLRLDPGVVYSDAQEFLTLVRSVRVSPGPDAIQRLERARTLYTGDLLERPDARRYAWVDERDQSGVTLREHFRRLFQQASVRLAELYAIDGELDASVELYNEQIELDPGDERLWRALFRLHAQRGDRTALVHEEQRLRQSLRQQAEEVDAAAGAPVDELAYETTQEFQRLLASLPDRDRQAATV